MSESVIEEYAHSCRIIEEERENDYNQYHYEGPMGRIKTFESPDEARLYADVQTVTGGFREEKSWSEMTNLVQKMVECLLLPMRRLRYSWTLSTERQPKQLKKRCNVLKQNSRKLIRFH